jgi:hypothetical protein
MKKILLSTFILLTVFACEKDTDKILIADHVIMTRYYDNEIFTEYNQMIYGKWQFLYQFGGYAGGKYDPQYDYLEVVKFGIYGIIKDHKVKEIGRLLISNQDGLETRIEFLPDDNYKTDYQLTEKLIRFEDSDHLELRDDAFDGYEYYYKRIK